jgi:hypothetical protein
MVLLVIRPGRVVSAARLIPIIHILVVVEVALDRTEVLPYDTTPGWAATACVLTSRGRRYGTQVAVAVVSTTIMEARLVVGGWVAEGTAGQITAQAQLPTLAAAEAAGVFSRVYSIQVGPVVLELSLLDIGLVRGRYDYFW